MSETLIIENNLDAAAPPSITDDITKGWVATSQWQFGNITYECTDNTENNAVWVIESDLGYYNFVLFGSKDRYYIEFKKDSTLLYRIKYNGRTKSKISSINLDVSGNGLKSGDEATLSIYESIGGTEVATITWDSNSRQNIEMNIIGTFPDQDCFLEFYGYSTGKKDKGRIYAITVSG